MFESFTEKARRVIFFARYEASQYGSPNIETEHLLLGLLRADPVLAGMFLGPSEVQGQIRTEIEQRSSRKERIGTGVEVPLAFDCKEALNLAVEESEKVGVRHVGTEHLLVGMLGVEKSRAAQLLRARGLTVAEVRAQLAKNPKASSVRSSEPGDDRAKLVLDSFLASLKPDNGEELIKFLARNAQFIDISGKRWNREEIVENFDTLFAPYVKINRAFVIEETFADGSRLLVASVLWKNAHRMSVVVIREAENWCILLLHATAVQPQ
jgi:hypothetical protein